MRIAYITAGAGGMFCGSCMRDNTLAAALHALGHECLLIPTYTPTRTDEENVSEPRVFFGGISIYLAQKIRLFRHLPTVVDRFLSRPGLLRWVTRSFGMKTRPEDLGDLTLSMLRGERGHQRKALDELVGWLSEHVKPEIICISTALLSGVVAELKRRLGVPIVIALQGDDIFLEWLPPKHREQAIALIRENCQHVDGFIATCRWYADFMAEYLGLPRERIHVVYPGIRVKDFDKPSPALTLVDPGRPLTIGYLARVCPEKGLHVLLEACNLLRTMPDSPKFFLRAAGHLTQRDDEYLASCSYGRRVLVPSEGFGWSGFVNWNARYLGELDHAGKIAFLQSLDILSVPTTYREPKGLYVLEAWAAGVPVVQPRHGSFPELIEMTGGGLLVNPDDPADLAQGLRKLLLDAELRRALGERGREGVKRQFTAERMAVETARVFELVVQAANAKPRAATRESP